MAAEKALKRVAGIKQTCAAIKNGNAACVYIASDVSPQVVTKVAELCELNDIVPITSLTSREIAGDCHIDVPCSASAILGS